MFKFPRMLRGPAIVLSVTLIECLSVMVTVLTVT